MFAISFDMVVLDLKEHFGEPYNNAYYEISKILRKYEFYNTQGSVYLSTNNNMANLFRAMNALKRIEWFKKSVRDIGHLGLKIGLILLDLCRRKDSNKV